MSNDFSKLKALIIEKHGKLLGIWLTKQYKYFIVYIDQLL